MLEGQAPVEARVDEPDELAAQQLAGPGGLADALDGQLAAQPLDELRGGADAQVGGDEGGLEVVPDVLIEAVGAQQIGERTGQMVVRTG